MLFGIFIPTPTPKAPKPPHNILCTAILSSSRKVGGSSLLSTLPSPSVVYEGTQVPTASAIKAFSGQQWLLLSQQAAAQHWNDRAGELEASVPGHRPRAGCGSFVCRRIEIGTACVWTKSTVEKLLARWYRCASAASIVRRAATESELVIGGRQCVLLVLPTSDAYPCRRACRRVGIWAPAQRHREAALLSGGVLGGTVAQVNKDRSKVVGAQVAAQRASALGRFAGRLHSSSRHCLAFPGHNGRLC